MKVMPVCQMARLANDLYVTLRSAVEALATHAPWVLTTPTWDEGAGTGAIVHYMKLD